MSRERSKTTNSAFLPSTARQQLPPSSPTRSLIFKRSPSAASNNHNNRNEKVVVPKSFTIDVKQIASAKNKLKNVNTGSTGEEMPSSITIEAPEKKGLLRMTTEKGGNPGEWDQKWCVLKEGRLYIFPTAKALLPEKTLSLQGSIVREKKDAGAENCFCINTLDGESIIFCTESDEDFDYLTWIVGLRAATLYIRISSLVIEAPPQLATATQPLSVPPTTHSLSVSQSPSSSPSSSPSLSLTPSPATSNSSSPSNTPPLAHLTTTAATQRGISKAPSQSSLPPSSSGEPTLTFSPSSPVLPKKGDKFDKVTKKDYNFLSKSADSAPGHLAPTPATNVSIGSYTPKFTQPNIRPSSPLTRPVDDLKSSAGTSKASRKGQLAVPEGRVLFGTRWKPRWVVLANDALSVYSSEGDEDKKDPIYNFEVIFCQPKVVKAEKVKYVFEIMGPTQSVQFSAVSSVELLEWIQAIQETQTVLMQSYLQYNMGSISTNVAKSKTTDDYESQVSLELEKSKKMLARVMKIPGNDVCADCGGPEPIWASINLGVFICIMCSGVHRQMGTHISKVRSLTMDKWECDTIEFMEANGNTRVNAQLERNIRPPHVKIVPTSSQQERETFIRCKYEGKVFAGT